MQGRILDIGCGTGGNLNRLMKAGHRVCAVDFDFDAVSTAQSLLKAEKFPDPAFFAVGRAEALPFHGCVFDEVHCVDVLHWASDAGEFEAMWREAWRVLKPAGSFLAKFRFADPPHAVIPRKTRWFLPDYPRIQTLVGSLRGEWMKPLETVMEAGNAVALATLKKSPA